MRNPLRLVIAACLAVASFPVLAADETPAAGPARSGGHAYVGVVVTSIHPALGRHLKGQLGADQGLMVEGVAENSPASRAGLKEHDILTAYENQKLFSAEQFAKLVHSDQPGREITLEFLRDGKPQSVKLTLGQDEHPRPRAVPGEAPFRMGPGRMLRRLDGHRIPGTDWDNFDSLTLKKLDKDRFRAEIQYFDADQKLQKHVFEGTRTEIHHAIVKEQGLGPNERAHLLRSLGHEFPVPSLWFEPGMGWYVEPPVLPFR